MTYVSAGVRLFTACPLNHTAIVSINERGQWVLNEAKWEGIISRPIEEALYEEHTEIVVLRDPRQVDLERIIARANAKVGTPYDLANLTIEQIHYRTGLGLCNAVKWASRGRLQPQPSWIGFTGEAAARRLQCAEYWAWVWERQNWWLYSSAEIWNDGMLHTVFNELKNKPR